MPFKQEFQSTLHQIRSASSQKLQEGSEGNGVTQKLGFGWGFGFLVGFFVVLVLVFFFFFYNKGRAANTIEKKQEALQAFLTGEQGTSPELRT